MVLKIIAKGFLFAQRAYIKELWNIMDFVIVTTAYLPYILTSGGVNLKALRALRVLRPLRTISKIKKLRQLILTLMSVFGDLIETLFVLFFFLMIFAIGGLQMFIGLSKKRCFESLTGVIIATPGQNSENGGYAYCNDDADCTSFSATAICGKMIQTIDNGATNYDDFAHAYLMSFQVITTEGWTEIMGFVQKTFNPAVAIYFLILVLCATFIILQLILAVLNGGFQTAAERVNEENSTKRGRKKVWHENEGLVKALEKNKVDIVDLLLKRKEGTNNTAKYKMKKSGLYAIEDRFSLAAFLGFASGMTITKKKKASKDNKISFFDKFNKRATVPTAGSRFADIVMKLKDMNKSLVFEKQTVNNLDENGVETKPMDQFPHRADSIVQNGQFVVDSPKKELIPKGNNYNDNNKETPNSDEKNTLKTTVSIKNLKETLSPDTNKTLENNKTLEKTADETAQPLQIKVNRITDESDNKPTESTPIKSPASRIELIEDLESPSHSDVKTPSHSHNAINSRSRLRPIISTKPTVTGPLRPDLASNKVSLNVESAEVGTKKPFQIVGIAGIRSHFQPKQEAKKVAFVEPEPEEDDFLEAVKNMEPVKPVKNESTSLNAKFFKKINNVQPRNVVPVHRTGKSYQTIDMDNDEINDSMVETNGVLDDSDFMDDRSKHIRHEKTVKRRKSQVKTEFRLVKPGYEMAGDEGHLKIEENDVGAKQPEHLETEIDDEEDDEFPLDLRLIQPDPIFGRQDYNSYSEDDVLPSLKENKKRLEEEEDMRRIREVTLTMEHVPTQTELKQAQARKDVINNRLILQAAQTIAIKKNYQAQRYKTIEQQIRAEREAEEAAEEMYITDRANSKKQTRGFNAIPKNAINLPGVCENNGEFTSFEMMLKKIEAKNEDEEDWSKQEFVDEQTQELPKPEQWLQIRVIRIEVN